MKKIYILLYICLLAWTSAGAKTDDVRNSSFVWPVDTAFVKDTAHVISTRYVDSRLVVDTTLMVTTTYVVDTTLRVRGSDDELVVSDSLVVRLVNGLSMPDTCIIEWTDSFALTVQFPLTVSHKEVKKDYCMWITPSLCGENDTMPLPAVIFQGKRHKKYNERGAWLSSRQQWYPQVPKGAPGDTLWYEMRVAVEPWMRYGSIDLCLEREKEGCCTIDTLATLCREPFRYVPPYNPVLPLIAPLVYPLAQENPVLHHLSDYRPYDGTQVLRKEPGVLYVYYPLNKSFLFSDYRANYETLDKIIDFTRRISADSAAEVRFIEIIGLASPEGPLDYNIRLAQRRAESLALYIQERTDYPDSLFRIISGGEAWTELRDCITDTDSTNIYREKFLQIIDSVADPIEREKSIRRLDGGKAYRYLMQKIMPELRNAGYIRIYYDNAPDRVAIIINRAIGLMQNGYNKEALAMLETVAYDERSYNALGNAYYVCGNAQQAVYYLQKAADNGQTGAAANLHLIKRRIEAENETLRP